MKFVMFVQILVSGEDLIKSPANLMTILNGFTELDLKDQMHRFVFVTDNLKRVPKFAPEELNLSDILYRLTQVEAQVW